VTKAGGQVVQGRPGVRPDGLAFSSAVNDSRRCALAASLWLT
jgi:hypothetical protein